MSKWTGDMEDDCCLLRYGMMAHAEKMTRGFWWFAVYSDGGKIGSDDLYNTAENLIHVSLTTGKMARAAAECVVELLHSQRTTPTSGAAP